MIETLPRCRYACWHMSVMKHWIPSVRGCRDKILAWFSAGVPQTAPDHNRDLINNGATLCTQAHETTTHFPAAPRLRSPGFAIDVAYYTRDTITYRSQPQPRGPHGVGKTSNRSESPKGDRTIPPSCTSPPLHRNNMQLPQRKRDVHPWAGSASTST